LKKRWIDSIREDSMDIGISIQEASHLAIADVERWMNTVRKMGCQSARTYVFVVTAISEVSQKRYDLTQFIT